MSCCRRFALIYKFPLMKVSGPIEANPSTCQRGVITPEDAQLYMRNPNALLDAMMNEKAPPKHSDAEKKKLFA